MLAPGGKARRDVALLAALTLAGLIPFLNKAYHIDDPVYIRVAQQIVSHPLDPFGFEMNWYGAAMPVYAFNQNPPGVSYYVAIFGALLGWEEIAIHGAMLLPALAAILGIYALASAFTERPLIAALAALFSPAFLVSGTNVMADVLLLAFYVWAVAAWVYGLREKRPGLLAASALLMSGAFLSKYFGVTLVPLLFAYGLAQERRIGAWAAWLLIPVCVVVAYQTWTSQMYGTGLFGAATDYAAAYGDATGFGSALRIGMTAMTFVGGCFVSALCFGADTWRRQGLIAGFVIAMAIASLVAGRVVALEPVGVVELSLLSGLLIGLFTATGIGVAILAARELRHRNAEGLLLFLWFFGTLVFSAYVNWTVNARSLLPLAPVVGVILARRWDELKPATVPAWRVVVPIAVSGALALWVAIGDYQFAGASRAAAQEFAAREDRDRMFFQGHWGFQYYMEEAGFPAQDYVETTLHLGDRIVIPSNNTNVRYYDPRQVALVETVQEPIGAFVTTTNIDIGAGFYSHGYGPMPFVIGPVPAQRFEVYRIEGE